MTMYDYINNKRRTMNIFEQ